MQRLEETLKKISAWWNGEYTGRPLLGINVNTEDSPPQSSLWTSPEIEPDFEKIVAAQTENIASHHYLAESYPALSHEWGISRGTPMTIAAYLGGEVLFREETVWIEPLIENWKKFNIQFDEKNYWASISKKLMETQLKKCNGNFLIKLPDLGDALTVFSLLRGVENLLIDLVERPDIIKEKIKDFTKTWIETHKYFHSLYVKKLPGDCCWLTWAPGKTYACQCDFSTMISPKMFEEFVAPEIEELGKYLDFIVWHLDGPDEIKHLDILLNLPEIKAIQIVPGAGNPPCASSLWLPQMKKIQEKEKLVFGCASTKEEVEILVKNLLPEKLFIGCSLPFSDVHEATTFINWVEKL